MKPSIGAISVAKMTPVQDINALQCSHRSRFSSLSQLGYVILAAISELCHTG